MNVKKIVISMVCVAALAGGIYTYASVSDAKNLKSYKTEKIDDKIPQEMADFADRRKEDYVAEIDADADPQEFTYGSPFVEYYASMDLTESLTYDFPLYQDDQVVSIVKLQKVNGEITDTNDIFGENPPEISLVLQEIDYKDDNLAVFIFDSETEFTVYCPETTYTVTADSDAAGSSTEDEFKAAVDQVSEACDKAPDNTEITVSEIQPATTSD